VYTRALLLWQHMSAQQHCQRLAAVYNELCGGCEAAPARRVQGAGRVVVRRVARAVAARRQAQVLWRDAEAHRAVHLARQRLARALWAGACRPRRARRPRPPPLPRAPPARRHPARSPGEAFGAVWCQIDVYFGQPLGSETGLHMRRGRRPSTPSCPILAWACSATCATSALAPRTTPTGSTAKPCRFHAAPSAGAQGRMRP